MVPFEFVGRKNRTPGNITYTHCKIGKGERGGGICFDFATGLSPAGC